MIVTANGVAQKEISVQLGIGFFHNTVEPPKRGQHGDKPFVLSREVVLFRRFLFLSLKMKHSSCLDTYTI